MSLTGSITAIRFVVLAKDGAELHLTLTARPSGSAVQLARIEGKCALEAVFKRWPHLELAIPPDSIRWRQRPALRAIEKLPIAPGFRRDQPA
jgi:hypothetical protein